MTVLLGVFLICLWAVVIIAIASHVAQINDNDPDNDYFNEIDKW